MNFKHLAVAAAVSSATFSGAALAQLSGNVGLTSEYFFRGLAQSGGSAVSGGLDYAAESGFYVGTLRQRKVAAPKSTSTPGLVVKPAR